MNEKTWDEILTAAGVTATALGLPQVQVATELARIVVRLGCRVVGCPADVEAELQPADIPTGENQLAARARIWGRAK